MLSAHEKIGLRGVGDGAIPLVQQRHVAIPAVGEGRQDEAGRHHQRERDERTPSKRSGQPRHQHEGIRLDEHAGGDGGSSREPPAVLRGDHRANQQQPDRQIELSERQFLDEELAGEENREPDEHLR